MEHIDQIINVRSKIYLPNDTNSGENDTGTYKRGHTDVKEGDSETMHPSITGLQPTDTSLLYPNTPCPKPADSFDPNIPSPKPADPNFIPQVTKPTVPNISIDDAEESEKSNSSSS